MSPFGAFGGLLVDQLLGEPPSSVHPVVGFGKLMNRVERRIYADRRVNGVAHLAIGVGVAVTAGLTLRRLIGSTAATVVATATCAAGKMLDGEAEAIAKLMSDGDLVGARSRLKSLVGRDTDELDESEISRAVIESVAENSVDAVTASLFWAVVAGAPGVLAHRAINTLDAMVGHHNDRYEHFGWASARIDDLVNFIPARASALAVAVVHPRQVASIWNAVKRDAPRHPSPNGGVIEAAYAAALGIRLGGVNQYGDTTEDRGTLGDGTSPTLSDIARAVSTRKRSTLIAAILMLIVSSLTSGQVGS